MNTKRLVLMVFSFIVMITVFTAFLVIVQPVPTAKAEGSDSEAPCKPCTNVDWGMVKACNSSNPPACCSCGKKPNQQ